MKYLFTPLLVTFNSFFYLLFFNYNSNPTLAIRSQSEHDGDKLLGYLLFTWNLNIRNKVVWNLP